MNLTESILAATITDFAEPTAAPTGS